MAALKDTWSANEVLSVINNANGIVSLAFNGKSGGSCSFPSPYRYRGQNGLLLTDFHTRGAIVNAASYCASLDRLNKAIRKKRQGLPSKGVLLLFDNTRPHMASVTRDLIQRFRWTVLGHSPHSPDLASSDFHLFGSLKKHLAGRHFRTDAEVQEAVVKWLRALDPDFFYAGFDRLVYR
ncbi:Mariner Mos1 transposase [Araneus ventricosus]|uniref:Mariner Mos1 transposase n=1 Tax=Araneus ventricosus TaxID=182803 RepID=A0A4Y2IKQ1_ARAVE|nr:Mariner Mos1 transposase [Araneus ventricosus]